MFGLTPYDRRRNEAARKGDVWDYGRSIFEDFFNDSFLPGFLSAGSAIRADIRENDKEYVVDAEIPGVNKEDIKLELRDGVLTILVDHDEEVKEERDNFIRRERRYSSFSRSFHVDNVKHEGVKAKYKDGILTVVLPKDENARPDRYRIDIQ
ncbi:MAG: Hsp20/alpha crystallin family protein [Bacillota bacterium]